MSTSSPLDTYILSRGGKRVIRRVLICNNGIAAVKCIRSIRKWAYSEFADEHAVAFVAMATPDDMGANAEYIRMADEYVEVPGGRNMHNYANVDLIVEIALRTRVDAVWAGWGHASENPDLPRKLAARGIAFMGPSDVPMAALGDKISSTIVAQSAEVPCMPWSGDGATTYEEACVHSAEEALAQGVRVGFPLMIKASEGGGGKGIRKCVQPEDIPAAFRAVSAEVPGSPIFLMKMASGARHLEVQLLGDEYGNAISLKGRDCSVQRRHQKIIEEGPVVAAPPELLEDMERAAIRLAQKVGYSSVGTVEYLYTEGKYYFLELNPRLQVEHPVSEWITGVNLPACQLHVACGVPLYRIPDIRRLYGEDPEGDSRIDFATRKQRPPKGHVIAVRITAENPEEGFQPSSGQIQEVTFRNSTDVWGYFSVISLGGVHQFADSQFGHIFAWGENREVSRKSLVMALKELSIRGDIRTTVEYLIHLLERQDYRRNEISTTWLDSLIATKESSQRPRTQLAVVCAAVHKAWMLHSAQQAKFVDALRRGRIPHGDEGLTAVHPVQLVYEGLSYSLMASFFGPQLVFLETVETGAPSSDSSDSQSSSVPSTPSSSSAGPSGTASASAGSGVVRARVRALRDGSLLIQLADGRSHVSYIKQEKTGLRLTVDSLSCFFPDDVDPSRLRSTMPGKVIRFLAQPGDHLAPNSPYVEIEVMKMYMQLRTPLAGTLGQLYVAEGTSVDCGELLASLVLDDPSQMPTVVPFEGSFESSLTYVAPAPASPSPLSSVLSSSSPSSTSSLTSGFAGLAEFRARLDNLRLLVLGYPLPSAVYATVLDDALRVLDECDRPAVCQSELSEQLSVLRANLPKALFDKFAELAECCDAAFSFDELQRIVHDALSVSSASAALQPLAAWAKTWEHGPRSRKLRLITDMIGVYLSAERPFNQQSHSRRREDVLLELRELNKNDLAVVHEIAFSRSSFVRRRRVLLALLDKIEKLGLVADVKSLLLECSGLTSKLNTEVSLTAKRLLMRLKLPSLTERLGAVARQLEEFASSANDQILRANLLRRICRSTQVNIESLFAFFEHPNGKIRAAAMEVYIRKVNHSFSIGTVLVNTDRSSGMWSFDADTRMHKHEGIVGAISVGDFSSLTSSGSRGGSLSPRKNSLSPTSGRMSSNFSTSDDSDANDMETDGSRGYGLLQVSKDISRMSNTLHDMLDECVASSVVVFKIVLLVQQQTPEKEMVAALTAAVQGVRQHMSQANVRRVTFCVFRIGDAPRYYTFRQRFNYAEDPIYRHVEPTLAYTLELRRLDNFNITLVPTAEQVHNDIHVYYAASKPERTSLAVRGGTSAPVVDRRFFVRTVISEADVFGVKATATRDLQFSEAERIFVECLNALEIAMGSTPHGDECYFNHIFLHWLPDVTVSPEETYAMVYSIALKHGKRLFLLRVSTVEVALTLTSHSAEDSLSDHDPAGVPVVRRLRLLASNPSMFALTADAYWETDGKFEPLPGSNGPLSGCEVAIPYPIFSRVDQRRILAHKNETPFVYDYPLVITSEIESMWVTLAKRVPSKLQGRLLVAVEYVLDPKSKELVPTSRPAGENTVGVVVWKMSIATPECSSAEEHSYRDIIVIANDITFQSGSFSTDEDELFHAASRWACNEGLPRVYLSANSGARIGLAEEVKRVFRVASSAKGGAEYLYVTPEDYAELNKTHSVIANAVTEGDETRYVITDIIGRKDGLGVENLRGSGLIAGETSRAYDETFTLSIVTGRSVGIGAYLVRLGQRVIQVGSSPILLTGAAALNKVLGKQVYASNVQIGGPQIMYTNGVTHVHVPDDVRAIKSMLLWLSYVAPRKSSGAAPSSLSVRNSRSSMTRQQTYFIEHPLRLWPDSNPNRDVSFTTQRNVPYDPRVLIQGDRDMGVQGIFDDGSFYETCGGWARNVITGRARLGGVPVGVIAVETRPVDTLIPADPADEASQEKVSRQAGQVWYPNSAFKTAQAIRDMSREKLPLFVLANWRGFSGGMRDMFDEVLKFGAMIVDALREYSQPVTVYIPPHGELRGGAWVVVDPSINSSVMEMYADPEARGGVLEPDGVVEIKFRDSELRAAMARLDPDCARLGVEAADPSLSADQRARVNAELLERQKVLMPLFRRVAEKFADLHDTPGRMLAKETVSAVVPLKNARRFFYARMCRRVGEHEVWSALNAGGECLDRDAFTNVLGSWLSSANVDYMDDAAVADWIVKNRDGSIAREINNHALQARVLDMARAAQVDFASFLTAMKQVASTLPAEQQQQLANVLSSK